MDENELKDSGVEVDSSQSAIEAESSSDVIEKTNSASEQVDSEFSKQSNDIGHNEFSDSLQNHVEDSISTDKNEIEEKGPDNGCSSPSGECNFCI